MADAFPIRTPSRLPVKIDPCPIVEAILELRFVTAESWRTLPGLFYASIRERYPQQRDLPIAQLPEDLRRSETALTYQPLVQFLSKQFIIQFGPRVVSLLTLPNQYPGWQAIQEEIAWLMAQVKSIGFIAEGERLGVRYVNFFAFDIFPHLQLDVTTGGTRLAGIELSVASVLARKPMTARLQVINSAILGTGDQAHHGSVVDIDVWLGSLDFDLAQNVMAKFGDAHEFEKQVFFGLLKPEFLATLHPVYE